MNISVKFGTRALIARIHCAR